MRAAGYHARGVSMLRLNVRAEDRLLSDKFSALHRMRGMAVPRARPEPATGPAVGTWAAREHGSASPQPEANARTCGAREDIVMSRLPVGRVGVVTCSADVRDVCSGDAGVVQASAISGTPEVPIWAAAVPVHDTLLKT